MWIENFTDKLIDSANTLIKLNLHIKRSYFADLNETYVIEPVNPYRAYMEALLNYGSDTKKIVFQSLA